MVLKIVHTTDEVYAHLDHWRREGRRIGLVPTMGALHEGHLSLVHRSRRECDLTVVSIFVNPTQFGPHEDFQQYPRTLESDVGQLRQAGVDLVFAPDTPTLYPAGFSTHIDPPVVADELEGKCRPGHFRGVATVVLKLFQLIPATLAYFGQKDYQQLLVIQHMVRDLNVPIRVVGCETVREPDGLALSSRNRYLSGPQRQAALSLWKALQRARDLLADGQRDVAVLESAMQQVLREQGADHIDYARVVDRETLAELKRVNGEAVGLIAVRIGRTRLIDNWLFDGP